MSARIGIGAALALLVGLAVWAAMPSSVVAPTVPIPAPVVSPASAPAQPIAQKPAVDVPPDPPPSSDVRARVDVCLAAQAQVTQQRAARGGPAPAGQPSDAAVVARACAPLYREAGCRQAQIDFDVPEPAARASTVLHACARDYCPRLPAPKPSACDPTKTPADGMETFAAWSDLRMAILRRDLGEAEAARAFPPR